MIIIYFPCISVHHARNFVLRERLRGRGYIAISLDLPYQV
jgi:hypothetical protein